MTGKQVEAIGIRMQNLENLSSKRGGMLRRSVPLMFFFAVICVLQQVYIHGQPAVVAQQEEVPHSSGKVMENFTAPASATVTVADLVMPTVVPESKPIVLNQDSLRLAKKQRSAKQEADRIAAENRAKELALAAELKAKQLEEQHEAKRAQQRIEAARIALKNAQYFVVSVGTPEEYKAARKKIGFPKEVEGRIYLDKRYNKKAARNLSRKIRSDFSASSAYAVLENGSRVFIPDNML